MKRENQADTLSSLAVLVSSAELQEFLSHWMTVNLRTLLAKKGNMKIWKFILKNSNLKYYMLFNFMGFFLPTFFSWVCIQNK